MKNSIKTVLGKHDVEEMTRQSFGRHISVAEMKPLEDGFFNAACLLRLSNGIEAVLKVSPTTDVRVMRYEQGMMAAEVEVLQLLKSAGLPVPGVYHYDNSRRLLDSEYFFMEKVKGTPYNHLKGSLSNAVKGRIEEQLGELNRKINEIKGTKFGSPTNPEYQSSDWSTSFLKLVQDLMLDAKEIGAQLPATTSTILGAFERHRDSLLEVTVPELVHWDLWDGNVFIEEERITGIIDCERALYGDPLMEFYFRNFEDPIDFLKGYGDIKLTQDAKIRSRMYDLYLDLILHIECNFRGYENKDHMNWAKDRLWDSWAEFSKTLLS